jgi:hypothetical protein
MPIVHTIIDMKKTSARHFSLVSILKNAKFPVNKRSIGISGDYPGKPTD